MLKGPFCSKKPLAGLISFGSKRFFFWRAHRRSNCRSRTNRPKISSTSRFRRQNWPGRPLHVPAGSGPCLKGHFALKSLSPACFPMEAKDFSSGEPTGVQIAAHAQTDLKFRAEADFDAKTGLGGRCTCLLAGDLAERAILL